MLEPNMPIHDRRTGKVDTANEHLEEEFGDQYEEQPNPYVMSPLKRFGKLMFSGKDEYTGV